MLSTGFVLAQVDDPPQVSTSAAHWPKPVNSDLQRGTSVVSRGHTLHAESTLLHAIETATVHCDDLPSHEI